MIISKKHYDQLNARIVELATQVSKANDILIEQELNKTPAVFVVDKIKEVIRRRKQNNFKIRIYV